MELCPGRVAAPTARVVAPGTVGGGVSDVASGVDEGLDAAAAEEHRARVIAEQQRRLDPDRSSGSDDEEEAEEAAAAEGGGGGGGRKARYDPTTDRSSIRLLPMHSLISFEDQMAAFAKADGSDMRTRVVIATNIAESSVTLPDVHTVIDFGRAKTIEYVPKLRASCLRATWISQASAAQRSGRAGRLMAGTVYRLYTHAFHDGVVSGGIMGVCSSAVFNHWKCFIQLRPILLLPSPQMPRYDTPEMLRLSLENVVLKVKLLGIRTAVEDADEEREDARAAAAAAAAASAAAASRGRLPSGITITGAGATSIAASLGVRPALGPPGGVREDAPPPAAAVLGKNSAKAVLSQSIQSPDPGSVDTALGKLAALGALTSAEDDSEVTPFGKT